MRISLPSAGSKLATVVVLLLLACVNLRVRVEGADSTTPQVRQRSVHEVTLTVGRDFNNPYTDVQVRARFAGPGGIEKTVNGFWDGGRVFKVRFTPSLKGRWQYTVQSQPADTGLSGKGEFEAIGPDRKSHGFLRRDARYPASFVFDDGSRYFMWGTTYYGLLSNARVRNWTGKYPVVNDEYGYIGEPAEDSEGKQPDGSYKVYTREKHRQTMWGIAAGGGYGAAHDKNLYDDGRPYKSGNWHDVPEYRDIHTW